jgi:hypothetical protein
MQILSHIFFCHCNRVFYKIAVNSCSDLKFYACSVYCTAFKQNCDTHMYILKVRWNANSFHSVLFYLNRLLPISYIGAWRLNQILKHVFRWLYFKPQRFKASGFLMPCQLALLDAEDEVLPRSNNYLPVNMVQHPRSLESSATLL